MSDETRTVTDHEKAILDRVKRLAERADPEHVEAAVSFTRQNLAALAALPVATAGPEPEPLRELLREAINEVHLTGSIRDHSDPNDRTGWNVHGIETCADPLCVAALAALRGAAAQADGGEAGVPVVCIGHCGSLGWTLSEYGVITHKHSCPRRTTSFCQSHRDGCPEAAQADTAPGLDVERLKRAIDVEHGADCDGNHMVEAAVIAAEYARLTDPNP